MLLTYCDSDKGRGEGPIQLWCSPTQDEVEFIVNGEVAIEVQASRMVSDHHLKGLHTLSSLMKLRRKIVVSRDKNARKVGDIEILPWSHFTEQLWSGMIF